MPSIRHTAILGHSRKPGWTTIHHREWQNTTVSNGSYVYSRLRAAELTDRKEAGSQQVHYRIQAEGCNVLYT